MFRLTRSRRLSRRSRAVSAVIGSAAVLWMVWIFVFQSSVPRREQVAVPPSEERLTFAQLASDEEIVVLFTAFQPKPAELRFRRDGAETKMIVSAVIWSEVDRAWKMARVLAVRPLTADEAAGLDALVTHLRGRAPADSPPIRYAIDYRRGDMSVGKETLWATPFVRLWNDRTRVSDDNPEPRRELDEQASREGVSDQALEKWVTFEQLASGATDDDPR